MNIADSTGLLLKDEVSKEDLVDTIAAMGVNNIYCNAMYEDGRIFVVPYILGCAQYEDIELLKILLDYGANPDTEDECGFPLLRYAIDSENINKIGN